MRAQLFALAALAPWCAAEPTEPTEAPADASPETGEQDMAPSNRDAGDPLELNVPLLGGGDLELASLRGRCVFVEISASWEAGYEEVHARFDAWTTRWAEPKIAIVAITVDPELATDDAVVVDPGSGIWIGWDPQGALAAQVRAATFPTFFVLDASGRIAHVAGSFDDQTMGQLEAQLDAVCTGSAGA